MRNCPSQPDALACAMPLQMPVEGVAPEPPPCLTKLVALLEVGVVTFPATHANSFVVLKNPDHFDQVATFRAHTGPNAIIDTKV